jgi:gas vesicle protein
MKNYEQSRDYDVMERSGNHAGLALLLAGIGIGAGVALLLASKPGKRMRKNLRRKYEDAREGLEGLSEQAADLLDCGGDWAKAARRRVAPIAAKVRL